MIKIQINSQLLILIFTVILILFHHIQQLFIGQYMDVYFEYIIIF